MRIVFMGTPSAAVPTLQKILDDGHEVVAVWTQPDKPAGRGNKLTVPPIKEFALANNLTVHQPVKIKAPETLELLTSHQADAAVVVAYGRILPESLLKAPRLGCINNHFSLLPKYRGAAPVNWAIVHGEATTGVTTMQMDAGLDTGNILLQREIDILQNETAPELLARLAIVGAELLSKTLQDLDELEPRTQHHVDASFAPIMKREDGLITWELGAKDIVNRIRGFQPFPNAFAYLGDKKLVLWNAVAESLSAPLAAGTILQAKGDDLLVVCGESSVLRVREVQLEGKRRMSVRDFLNGAKLESGEKFV
ncbi:MAG: methionyl-tRNA formyltransferase [Pyrinomonadaceae bacterium]